MRPVWRKSSTSSGNDTDSECVEVAFIEAQAAVRDSKDPVESLAVPVEHWKAFLGRLS
jgi:hypothetical protein